LLFHSDREGPINSNVSIVRRAMAGIVLFASKRNKYELRTMRVQGKKSKRDLKIEKSSKLILRKYNRSRFENLLPYVLRYVPRKCATTRPYEFHGAAGA